MIVYSVKNTVDGKRYIGATSRALFYRKWQHKSRSSEYTKDSRSTPLYIAIRQFGWDTFIWEVLEKCCDLESLYASEKKWIKHFNSMDDGYNLTLGGLVSLGYVATKETRKKISIIHKGIKQSREVVENRTNKVRGRRHTIKAIGKMRGRIVSEETRIKIGDASRGRKIIWSQQARKNVADAAKRKSENGTGAKMHPSFAPEILTRRENNESFSSIANVYKVTASAVFYFCKRHAA